MSAHAIYFIILKRSKLGTFYCITLILPNFHMGNCMHGNSIANPTPIPKKNASLSRKSKRNSVEIPTYPSIEDVINNNRRRRLMEEK